MAYLKIISDFGGVLFKDVDGGYYKGVCRSLADSLKTDASKIEELFMTARHDLITGRRDYAEFTRDLAERFGTALSDEEIEEAWLRPIRKTEPRRDVYGLFHKLWVANRYELVILSNVFRPHGEFHKASGHYKPFSKAHLSYEIGARKPEPEAYGYAAGDTPLHQCIFIDDQKQNIAAAAGLGMRAIFFQGARQLLRELRELELEF